MSELVIDIIRESVSLGVLVLVLWHGYKLLDRLLTMADFHLVTMENKLDLFLELVAQIRDEYSD